MNLTKYPPGPHEPDRFPHEFGAYILEGVLGEGGMGIVYRAVKAESLAHGVRVPVAVKVPDRKLLQASQTMAASMVQEASAAARISHANVVRLDSVGLFEGIPFMAMELLEGVGLDEQLANGPLDADSAIQIAIQICSGLQAIHDVGLVHRDVKPSNIFWTHSGTAKLLDMGIARALDATTRFTATGTTKGTPGYMPPEQLDGPDVDARADIFALGAVLAEAVLGEPVFWAGSLFSLIDQVRDSEKRLAAIDLEPRLEVSRAGLGKLVVQLLSADPGERPASAAEVRSRLQRLTTHSGAPQPPAPPAHSGKVESTRALPISKSSPQNVPVAAAAPPPTKAAPKRSSKVPAVAGIGMAGLAILGGLVCLGAISVGGFVALDPLAFTAEDPPATIEIALLEAKFARNLDPRRIRLPADVAAESLAKCADIPDAIQNGLLGDRFSTVLVTLDGMHADGELLQALEDGQLGDAPVDGPVILALRTRLRSWISTATRAKKAGCAIDADDLLLVVDQEVPWPTLEAVLFTSQRAGFQRIHFQVTSEEPPLLAAHQLAPAIIGGFLVGVQIDAEGLMLVGNNEAIDPDGIGLNRFGCDMQPCANAKAYSFGSVADGLRRAAIDQPRSVTVFPTGQASWGLIAQALDSASESFDRIELRGHGNAERPTPEFRAAALERTPIDRPPDAPIPVLTVVNGPMMGGQFGGLVVGPLDYPMVQVHVAVEELIGPLLDSEKAAGTSFGGITADFTVGRAEIATDLWTSLMSAKPDQEDAERPVHHVSWCEAVRFANALSAREGVDPAYRIEGDPGRFCDVELIIGSTGFRLPTVHEWELAARAGQDHAFAGSDEADAVAWFDRNSSNEIDVPCKKEPNRLSLCDMSGNVAEWTWDGAGNEHGLARRFGGQMHVKGGAFWSTESAVRIDSDDKEQQNSKPLGVGLRLVRSLEPHPGLEAAVHAIRDRRRTGPPTSKSRRLVDQGRAAMDTDPATAIAAFRLSLQGAADDPDALVGLARALVAVGETEGARFNLCRTLKQRGVDEVMGREVVTMLNANRMSCP